MSCCVPSYKSAHGHGSDHFCLVPNGGFEIFYKPQGRSASHGWFDKVINEITKRFEQPKAYLNNATVYNYDPLGPREDGPHFLQAIRPAQYHYISHSFAAMRKTPITWVDRFRKRA